MCTILAKKFPGIGWIGVKNRDRPAPTDTNLLRDQIHNVQRVTLVDDQTQWSEGMNSTGVSIISSSLSPAVSNHPVHVSKDGLKIRNALSYSTVENAVAYLEESKIIGCVMVFDADQLWLIEGQAGTHAQVIRKINEPYIARTNHGVWLPTAGYQPDSSNVLMKMRRISSEARLDIARYILSIAKTPNDLITLLAHKWSNNPQLTTLRYPTPEINDRTTEQLMLEPRKKFIFLRNTDGMLDFTQQDANTPTSKVLVGLIK